MRLHVTCLWMVLIGILAVEAFAQRPATSVQLPTFSSFTTSTTVSVPDGGSVLLGGVNRASSGQNEFGSPLSPLRNRSMGSERSASSVRVSATIHDFQAMDEYLLGQGGQSGVAGQSRPLPSSQPNGAAMGKVLLPRNSEAGRSWLVRGETSAGEAVEPADATAPDIQARRNAAKAARAEEAMANYERGQRAEAEGKPNVAKIYYQMVVRRADDDLRDRALARLEVVAPRTTRPSQIANALP